MPGDISCSVLDSAHRRRLVDDVRERLFAAPWGDPGLHMRVEAGGRPPGAAFRVHVSAGPPDGAGRRWRALNAAAPCLAALFGTPAAADRLVLLGARDDAAAELTDFALDADWVLGPPNRPVEPFLESLLRGEVTLDDWRRHLETLGPAVRPGAGFEVRCIGGLPGQWHAAPLVLLAGILADDDALGGAEAVLGAPDPARLRGAIRAGMGEPAVAETATALFRLALDAGDARNLAPASMPVAREYFERFTARGLVPGG